MSTARRWTTLVCAASAVLLVDQLTKWWAVKELAPPPEGAGRVIEVIGSLRFLYAENTGMAFSAGTDSGRWIGLIVIGVIAALCFFATRVHTRAAVLLLGVVIGGALGNLVDRALRANDGWLSGAVVDFLDLQWWPVFNVADAAVVLGGVALVFIATREPSDPDAATTGPETTETTETTEPAGPGDMDPNGRH